MGETTDTCYVYVPEESKTNKSTLDDCKLNIFINIFNLPLEGII